MVSFQTPFPDLNQTERNSKKRKWDDDEDYDEDTKPQKEIIFPYKLLQWNNNNPKASPKSFSDIELHLETPLPSEWQRCLDIQSGEIHFYNTRTQKRISRDPRGWSISPEPPSPPPTISRDHSSHMSLDLELNLPCGSLNNNNYSSKLLSSSNNTTNHIIMNKKSGSSPPPPPPPPSPPVTTDFLRRLSSGTTARKNGPSNNEVAEDEDEAAEMVATACMRCHMLVMLCKSSPTCPNCKFMHPPHHSPSDLFKPRLSLSC